MYHPDRSVENKEQAAANEAIFVKMKESFEKLVDLDKESGGQLFQSAKELKKAAMERRENELRMQALKLKIKEKKQKEKDLKRRQQEAVEKQRLEERARIEKVRREAYE